ncbi:MAG: serine/threonine protein kinase [Pirellula sp.]
MSSPDDSLEMLFEQALLRENPLEREQWLQSVLGNDPDKLQEVRDLIANDEESDWMDKPRRIVTEISKLIEDMRGKQVGPFLLVEKIGSGGMGDVYLAKQLTPVRRYVAVKLIFRDTEHQQIVERFQREIQMLANMEHPNIARIIDAGTTDAGISYIAMEYVKGHSIVEYCKLNQLNIRARLELHLQCCRAIQHAHHRGIIHRDIKPSNVMVTLVDAEPMVKVIDFGIAKAALSESVRKDNEYSSSIVSMMSMSITSHGISPGTPPYMSPEQFPKSGLEIDIRSDIYSLGALLYVMLTDQNPFDDAQLTDKSLEEIGELIGNFDPLLPSQRIPQLAGVLRGDLDSIVRKAMSRDVEKRYQSVAQFSEDLRHYLSSKSVSANPGNSWVQFLRLAGRNQLLIVAAALVFAGMLVGWLIAVYGAR